MNIIVVVLDIFNRITDPQIYITEMVVLDLLLRFFTLVFVLSDGAPHPSNALMSGSVHNVIFRSVLCWRISGSASRRPKRAFGAQSWLDRDDAVTG